MSSRQTQELANSSSRSEDASKPIGVPTAGAPASGRLIPLILGVLQLGPLLVLLVLAVVASLLSSLFLTERNIDNVLLQSSVVGILALGQLVVILTKGIDLSVGSTLALSTVVGALLTRSGHPVGVVVAAMVGAGACVGLANGLLIVKAKLQPFIVTLAMLSVASGIAFQISDGNTIPHVPTTITDMANGQTLGVPTPAVIMLIATVVLYVITKQLKWGRWIYATGGNPEAASRVGIPVSAVLVSVYVISGVCAGVAAIIVAGRTGSGYPSAGAYAELNSIAAAIIGGASLFGGRGVVWGAIVGALTIGVIQNALDLLAVGVFLQLIVIGLILLLAVKLDAIRGSLETRLRVARTELD